MATLSDLVDDRTRNILRSFAMTDPNAPKTPKPVNPKRPEREDKE